MNTNLLEISTSGLPGFPAWDEQLSQKTIETSLSLINNRIAGKQGPRFPIDKDEQTIILANLANFIQTQAQRLEQNAAETEPKELLGIALTGSYALDRKFEGSYPNISPALDSDIDLRIIFQNPHQINYFNTMTYFNWHIGSYPNQARLNIRNIDAAPTTLDHGPFDSDGVFINTTNRSWLLMPHRIIARNPATNALTPELYHQAQFETAQRAEGYK